MGRLLTESNGQRDASAALTKYASRSAGLQRSPVVSTAVATVGATKSLRLDVPHRERPRWHIAQRFTVEISARASRNGFRPFDFGRGHQRIPKHSSLSFQARTDAPRPYTVYWQVVNTGDEAARAGGLRGGIFPGSLSQTESTLYRGQHWIECFIVKGEQCVARSGEFEVNIE